MSEYQYYESHATDRPLTAAEMADLRDLDVHTKSGDFRLRFEALQSAHARKPSFIARLRKAGL